MLSMRGLTLCGGGSFSSNISARVPRIRGIDCTLEIKCLYSYTALNLFYINIKGEMTVVDKCKNKINISNLIILTFIF